MQGTHVHVHNSNITIAENHAFTPQTHWSWMTSMLQCPDFSNKQRNEKWVKIEIRNN